MKVVSAKLTNQQGLAFKLLCESNGHTMNSTLKSWILEWEKRKQLQITELMKKEKNNAIPK